MKNRYYHIIFWIIYLSYITLTMYLVASGTGKFLFPETVFDIVLSNIITSILPFYAFYYVMYLFAKEKKYTEAVALFFLTITIKLLLEFYLFKPFQNMLYGFHDDYDFLGMTGVSFSSNIKMFIFSLAYYFLTRVRTADQEVLTLQKEKLETEQKKLQAEVAYLKAQINPHFLQNVLNFFYAQALPHSDELAEGILLLSEIMRYAMDKNEDNEGRVWVSNEIKLIKKFNQIQQLRFQGKIFTNFAITGSDISGLKIIPMVMITLVENAYKHGDLHNPKWPVQIEADYNEKTKLFAFSVANRIKKGPKELSHGIGLENIRARLEREYNDNATIKTEIDPENYKITLLIKY